MNVSSYNDQFDIWISAKRLCAFNPRTYGNAHELTSMTKGWMYGYE